MTSLWQIFRTLSLLGSIGFGGAMPMLALIHRELVERRRWIDPAQFAEGVALAQSLPGPIAVDTVAYIGHRLRGWKGAVVATCAFLLPSFALMVLLNFLYVRHGLSPRAGGAFQGIGAAVVGLIMAICLKMGKQSAQDAVGILLPLISFLLLYFFRAQVLIILSLGALSGILIFLGRERQKA